MVEAVDVTPAANQGGPARRRSRVPEEGASAVFSVVPSMAHIAFGTMGQGGIMVFGARGRTLEVAGAFREAPLWQVEPWTSTSTSEPVRRRFGYSNASPSFRCCS